MVKTTKKELPQKEIPKPTESCEGGLGEVATGTDSKRVLPPQPQPQQQQQQQSSAAANKIPDQPPRGVGNGGMKEAISYAMEIEKEFPDQPNIYNEFLEIMGSFSRQEIDTRDVIDRVTKLFHGYNNLILGFHKFLPNSNQIVGEGVMREKETHGHEQNGMSRLKVFVLIYAVLILKMYNS